MRTCEDEKGVLLPEGLSSLSLDSLLFYAVLLNTLPWLIIYGTQWLNLVRCTIGVN